VEKGLKQGGWRLERVTKGREKGNNSQVGRKREGRSRAMAGEGREKGLAAR
jgi:hypothetical protein